MRRQGVRLPRHFFGELAATLDGCQLLAERRRLLDELCEVVREAANDVVGAVDSDDSDYEGPRFTPLQRRAAVLALAHVGAAEHGLALLDRLGHDVVALLVPLAEGATSLSTRGVAFYALGLLCGNEAAHARLREFGWLHGAALVVVPPRESVYVRVIAARAVAASEATAARAMAAAAAAEAAAAAAAAAASTPRVRSRTTRRRRRVSKSSSKQRSPSQSSSSSDDDNNSGSGVAPLSDEKPRSKDNVGASVSTGDDDATSTMTTTTTATATTTTIVSDGALRNNDDDEEVVCAALRSSRRHELLHALVGERAGAPLDVVRGTFSALTASDVALSVAEATSSTSDGDVDADARCSTLRMPAYHYVGSAADVTSADVIASYDERDSDALRAFVMRQVTDLGNRVVRERAAALLALVKRQAPRAFTSPYLLWQVRSLKCLVLVFGGGL